MLNGLGVVLMWALFARDYSPLALGGYLSVRRRSPSAPACGSCNPELEWYVGASGALHGVMTAGTLAHLRRRDLDGWILAIFIIAKLAYEQFAGAMPFAGAANTIVDAHLYGAVGGCRARAAPEVAPRAALNRESLYFAPMSANNLAFVFPGQGSQSVGMLAQTRGSIAAGARHVR